MIDRVNKLILVHLPKTGGTSGAAALRSGKHSGVRNKHWRLCDYQENLPDFAEYHSFGFVRNPWARMVAWHRFSSSRNPNFKKPFDQWVVNPESLPVKEEEYFFLDGKFALDSVGRFENLVSDFKRIVRPFLGEIEFPHFFNLRSQRNYADYYTQETIEIVAKRRQWVIERFGYSFDDLIN